MSYTHVKRAIGVVIEVLLISESVWLGVSVKPAFDDDDLEPERVAESWTTGIRLQAAESSIWANSSAMYASSDCIIKF
jgi:hypothetical protein